MAHDHSHQHGDANSYYLEQLFTVAVCGSIGAVMVMLYATGRIRHLLVADQHMGVLLGGILLGRMLGLDLIEADGSEILFDSLQRCAVDLRDSAEVRISGRGCRPQIEQRLHTWDSCCAGGQVGDKCHGCLVQMLPISFVVCEQKGPVLL